MAKLLQKSGIRKHEVTDLIYRKFIWKTVGRTYFLDKMQAKQNERIHHDEEQERMRRSNPVMKSITRYVSFCHVFGTYTEPIPWTMESISG